MQLSLHDGIIALALGDSGEGKQAWKKLQ